MNTTPTATHTESIHRSRWTALRRLPGPRGGRPLLLVPGATTAYLGFNSGGYFGGEIADVAIALLLALLLMVTVASRPFAGWTPSGVVVSGALAAFAAWLLLSSGWSHAPARALLEFDRALVYLLAFALMASMPRRPGDVAVLLRWVLAAIVAVAAAGLATRLMPDVVGAFPGRDPSRLSWPLTYWNAMGVICAVGWVLALHGAAGGREPLWMRALAGACLPVLATAGYLPLSRGGIATAVVGGLLFVVLARPPRLLVTLLTAGPSVAVALVTAYHADVLTTAGFARGAGPAQGHREAAIVVACAAGAALLRVLASRLDPLTDRLAARSGRRGFLAAVAVIAVALIAAGVAIDAPSRVREQYRAFVNGNVVDPGKDTRQRLTSSGNNGRLALWRVSRSSFSAEPWHGTGAGTFEVRWARERPIEMQALDGHSLYLETLGELGVVGLALLVLALGGILLALGRGLRGDERHAYAAACAAGLALLAHAAIDWDWEMPALFVWLFAAGGLATARPAGGAERPGPPRLARVVCGIACLLLAVTPYLVGASDRDLRRAWSAFARGDCPAATDAALDSAGALSQRPEPYELIGYCDLQGGQVPLGLRAMSAARRRDPENWRFAYGLALARAFAGTDPRDVLAVARRLNPLEPEVRTFARAVRRSHGPAGWHRAAVRARLPF